MAEPNLQSRVPPNSVDTEGAILGAVLLEPERFDQVAEVLSPEHFYADSNRRIWEAILALQEASKPLDIVAVAEHLRGTGRLQQVGGTPYLAQLLEQPAIANLRPHAEEIRAKWRLRQIISVCQKSHAEAYDAGGEVQEFLDRVESQVFEVAQNDTQTDRLVRAHEALTDAFSDLRRRAESGNGITGTPSGLAALDRRTTGQHAGDLYIVAGRPGMGKSGLALCKALHAASQGIGALFLSLEMPRDQLAMRAAAVEGRVDVSRIRSGVLRSQDWDRLVSAGNRISGLPLWFDDTPGLTLLALRAKIRRTQTQCRDRGMKLGLVVVDYLQLMRGPKSQSREQEVSALSRSLKEIAKEFGVAMVVLSQLNRSVETRSPKDKRPQLSDLRESGSIEQDADAVMFVYRDEYYHKESADQGIAEIIIAKQRNGPTGTCKVRYLAEFTRFENLPDGYESSEPRSEFDDLVSEGWMEDGI